MPGLSSEREAGEHGAEWEALCLSITSLRDHLKIQDGKRFVFPAAFSEAIVLLERGQGALQQMRQKGV